MILKYSLVREKGTGREGVVIDHVPDPRSPDNALLTSNVVEFRDVNGYPVNKMCLTHELEVIGFSPHLEALRDSDFDPLVEVVELQEENLVLRQLLKRAGRLATAIRHLVATPLHPDGFHALETVVAALEQYENGCQEFAINGNISDWEIPSE